MLRKIIFTACPAVLLSVLPDILPLCSVPVSFFLTECLLFIVVSCIVSCNISSFVSCGVVTCCTVLYRMVFKACLLTHKGSGSCFHFCPRPCLSSCRWAKLTTHRHIEPHSMCPVLARPPWPCNHRMCVIARRLGCLDWLAHAARHEHFQGASTSSRTDSFV